MYVSGMVTPDWLALPQPLDSHRQRERERERGRERERECQRMRRSAAPLLLVCGVVVCRSDANMTKLLGGK